MKSNDELEVRWEVVPGAASEEVLLRVAKMLLRPSRNHGNNGEEAGATENRGDKEHRGQLEL